MTSINIHLLKNEDIDKNRWDITIEQSINGLPFAYSWYLDATFPNWSALVSDDYNYVFPITNRKKLGLNYWYSPIYTMQLGLFSKNKLSSEIIEQFYNKFPQNIVSFDFSLNSHLKIVPNNFKSKSNTCQFIDLSNSYHEISKAYSKNLKRNLKKAQNVNLQIAESTDIFSVVKMFRENRGQFIQNVSEKDYKTLYNLIENSLSISKGKIFHVYYQTELVASCFFSFTNNRITYHKGGVNQLGKQSGAMHFLIDQIIQNHTESNYIFDFGGSSIPEVKQFNFNFGKQEYTYLQISKGNPFIDRLRKLKQILFHNIKNGKIYFIPKEMQHKKLE